MSHPTRSLHSDNFFLQKSGPVTRSSTRKAPLQSVADAEQTPLERSREKYERAFEKTCALASIQFLEADIAIGQAEVKAGNARIKSGEKRIKDIKEVLLSSTSLSSENEPRAKRPR